MSRFLKFFLLTSVFSFYILSATASAQGFLNVGCDPFGKTAPKCQPCHLLILVDNLINLVIEYSVLAAAAFIFYAGFLMLLSGSSGGYTKGKEMIITVVKGLALVLSAWVIVNTIFTVLTGNFPWQEIRCAPKGGSFIDVYRDVK